MADGDVRAEGKRDRAVTRVPRASRGKRESGKEASGNRSGNAALEPGTKFNKDKIRVDLVDPEFIYGITQAAAYGADKYAEWNWLGGFGYRECTASVLRHIFDWLLGEEYDEEASIHHLSMAGAQLMFLHRMAMHRDKYGHLDNRPDYKGAETREKP